MNTYSYLKLLTDNPEQYQPQGYSFPKLLGFLNYNENKQNWKMGRKEQ